jgi:hypothetical protein
VLNALSLCSSAFRQANIDQTLTSLSEDQDFPYNIAKDLLNTVIQDVNRQGNFWFTQTSVQVTPVQASIDLAPLGIDPKKIIRLRREHPQDQGDMIAINWRVFQQNFRQTPLVEGRPTLWSKFNQTLQLNVIPDKSYNLTVYYHQDIPLIQSVSDAVVFPDSDGDILREGVFAYLLLRLGRADFATAYQLYQTKLKSLLANQKQDSSLPTQMPANF